MPGPHQLGAIIYSLISSFTVAPGQLRHDVSLKTAVVMNAAAHFFLLMSEQYAVASHPGLELMG